MTDELSCAICSGPSQKVVEGFSELSRVTSDCRPFDSGGVLAVCDLCGLVQKPASETWLFETGRIYDDYDIFRQAEDGDEQLVFISSSGESMRRSFAVLHQLSQILPFPRHGTALDVGCGNGAMLKAIVRYAPGWQLHGTEQSDSTRPQLEGIPGFEQLHTGDVASLTGRYELVTLSHSLEHFVEPVADLAKVAQRLSAAGLLIVQVPDCARNFYDILVADHRSHFTAVTLARCALEAGLEHFVVTDRLVPKELTLVASPDQTRIAPLARALRDEVLTAAESQSLGHRTLISRVNWLGEVQRAARETAGGGASFGIFGTSIAGTWLFGGLRSETAFFVDEDPSRIGKQHEGLPIIAPRDIPVDANVFLCLIPSVAAAVEQRLGTDVPGRLVSPPPFGD